MAEVRGSSPLSSIAPSTRAGGTLSLSTSGRDLVIDNDQDDWTPKVREAIDVLSRIVADHDASHDPLASVGDDQPLFAYEDGEGKLHLLF